MRALVIVLLSTLALPAPVAGAAKAKPAPRLQSFSSCTDLVGYARRGLKRTHGVPARTVGPVGIVNPAPAPMPTSDSGAGAAPMAQAPASAEKDASGGGDFSTTNVQEEGVDEPDIVKTDG